MSFEKGMYYKYKHIFAGIHIPIDKHIFNTNIVSNYTWDFGLFSYKTHCTGGNYISERNELILLLVSVLHSFFNYLINWINIQLNVHFYFISDDCIYSDIC